MIYMIIILIIVALISVAYVWYMTRGLNGVSDSDSVLLHTDEDKVLSKWYESNVKPTFDFGLTTQEIAAKFLERIYDIKVDPNYIVVGENLQEQYETLTRNKIIKICESSDMKQLYESDININWLFDLRSLIAKSVDIVIISNKKVKDKLLSVEANNNYDLSEINNIMESNLDKDAYEYLQGVLKIRWDKINEIRNSHILNSHGSYLYLEYPKNDNIASDNIKLNGNIIAARSFQGARINLLCNNWEFEALISRLKATSRNIEEFTDPLKY